MNCRSVSTLCAGLVCLAFGSAVWGQANGLKSRTTYDEAYGKTKAGASIDPAKDLPRYPAVEPKEAIQTWQVKKGFKLELAANEPQVRSPIAASFDENGRMFVCEMIDYSEMRDVRPHLGRISMLEDKDGDGHFETSRVFADDLPWPTGVLWANGGVYVCATPDVFFFKDTDGDGKADVREVVLTGFGTGLKLLNVQGLVNNPQWGIDNRIHLQSGVGNKGLVQSPKRPDLKAVEISGHDVWFDPVTHEFGLEAGGAQYGMSYDDYGRKFACSNSDHLQYFVYDEKYAQRNPYYRMPPSRQSIAVDGGAAEVFRLSPDEPWRIIRTRWRISGVVKGAVEGGGRVSGYFTGATGTTIYRGDAYGPEFVNNSFSGDAGGQLVHRKQLRPTEDGVSLLGERPADERGFEFAASKDTWVRVTNFANAPDGCLHVMDMYREVIEHPWSIPDEIKKHIDLNSGSDRGRIYRIVREGASGRGTKVMLGQVSTAELVKTLHHANGWHRDTATRLLFERQDRSALPLLEGILRMKGEPLAKLHALSALRGMKALNVEVLKAALQDEDGFVAERGCVFAEGLIQEQADSAEALVPLMVKLTTDKRVSERTRFQAFLTLGSLGKGQSQKVKEMVYETFAQTLLHDERIQSPLLFGAIASAPPEVIAATMQKVMGVAPAELYARLAPLVETLGALNRAEDHERLFETLTRLSGKAQVDVMRALGAGLRRAGSSIEKADSKGVLKPIFAKAVGDAGGAQSEAVRLEAISLLGLTQSKEVRMALVGCLQKGQPDAVQAAAVKTLMQGEAADLAPTVLAQWGGLGAKAREATLAACLERKDRTLVLLGLVGNDEQAVKATDFSAAQVQVLAKHSDARILVQARKVLAEVIPPSREEVVAKFQAVAGLTGDAVKGQVQFMARCFACHRANGTGVAVGPDLITVKTKGRDGLLTAILEPHKEVAPQYIAYQVVTKDGQALHGIISKDDASALTLKMMGGAEQTIARSQIQGSTSSGQSLMPEGLEQGMTPQDMADLLSFIEAVK